ncbi:elongation factor Tu [Streptococcus hillyeri]|uniref:elongation factor Tu n=1 Tax=Streptococcus hillyeri TaxID=2282420 RepID=UPI0034E2A0F7
MNHLYAVETKEQLEIYQQFVKRYDNLLQDYVAYLSNNFQVDELPEVILWSDKIIATKYIRDIAVPAYTNDVRMVMTPELSVWQELYEKQLDDYEATEQITTLRQHYQNISENYLLQIVGHELAHWSELFLDDFDDDLEQDIWFEEGMVEYISRRYFLTETEFEAEKSVNQELVALYQEKYGWHSLSEFGQKTYEGSYAAIFYEYWRSFLAIDQLVEKLGTVQAIFASYHDWSESKAKQSLLEWFGIES